MNVLIRYLRKTADGGVEAQDSEVILDVISIGSAADRDIQLLGRDVGANHALILGSAAKLKIACQRGFKIRLNGVETGSAPIAAGDEIQLSGHVLRIVKAPAGFDVAIEVQLNSSADASEFETAFRTNLSQTWLSMRSGAWTLAILTLLLAFAIPLTTIFMHRQGASTPRGVPDDTVWTAGPLTAAHEHAAGKKCSACHQQLFVHVQDDACRKCHQPIADHVSQQHLLLTQLGAPQRCAQCHREHDGGASELFIKDDQLCVACHARSQPLFGTLKVKDVAGFSQGAHPAFDVTLQKPADTSAGGAMSDWVTRREPLATAHEQSNLKFSHAQHLDAAHVTRARDGGALGCGDCHTPAVDGEHFLPVTMARSCASCHELTFDPGAPTRQLPHGKPLEAMLVIEDYFARKYSEPASAAPHPAPLRRLPDREKDTAVTADVCTGPTYLCAGKRATAEIENQFAGRGCVSCHTVTDNHAKDVHDRFQVMPIRLTYDYFAGVRFSHKAHAIQKDPTGRDLTGDDACLSCHKARQTSKTADLMIPDIGKCLACHGDRHVDDRVTVQCVSCHTYHPVPIMEANSDRLKK
jgi:predicted CXXCH cytochrome family protein